MKNYFMGVDIGTSSVRAVLFDIDGRQIHLESVGCTIDASSEGYAELDPDEIVGSMISVIRRCVGNSGVASSSITGIGLSCHMHSLMAVDAHGRPLTRLILWADSRAKAEADFINKNYDVGKLYKKTGCRVQHPMYPLSKILWLRQHQPAVYRSAYKFITIKEYIIFSLFGEFLVDYTLVSCQGYYNINTQCWDGDILRGILGITEERLSTVVECSHVLRGIKSKYAQAMGLDMDIPVVIGSGDGILANIGSGVFNDTTFSSTIGTSGAIRTMVDAPLFDINQKTWCYAFSKDKWVAGGAINNGGISLKWLQETFKTQFEADAAAYGESVYRLFDRFAGEIPAGSDGLIFLPMLMGERSPDWNANVRGLMYGLSLAHGRKHIIRAAMEGVIYRLYSVYNLLSGMKTEIKSIYASGGYCNSDVWLQIQADMFNKEICVPGVNEVSALGAAYLAMCELGAVGDFGQQLESMKPAKICQPNYENHLIYQKAYVLAKEIYNDLY